MDSIAEQKTAEERLELVLELSREWYWEQDERHRFTLFRGASAVQAGIDVTPYIGKTRWDGDGEPVGDEGNWDAHKAAMGAHEEFRDFYFRRVDANGELRYISTSGKPIFENGVFTGYRGIAR